MAWQRLDEADTGAVLDVVDEIRRARTLESYADVAMAAIFHLIECQDVSYNEMNPAAGRIDWKALPDQGALMDDFAPIFARLMRQNPLVRHFEETGDTRAMMWSDFLSVEQIHATELHREMFRHLGIDHQMAVTLPTPSGIVIGFAVNGPTPFSERDRAILNTLRPYLSHTYRTIQLGDELSEIRRSLQDGGWSSALVNGDGEVRESIRAADDALEAIGVEIREGERLPAPLRDGFVSGVSAYDPSTPAVPSRGTRMSDEADGVEGRYVPSPIGPHVVLVQTGADRARRRLEAAGLSQRQVTVALHLAEGGTNQAIADRLGIAEGTVRKHLEHVYRALGVEDRASAVAAIHGR